MSEADALLAWYRASRRDLPWRRTTDPYAIWVSEIMLQQTQVQTVIPYFERWMSRFPTVESLASAEVDDVLAIWQGLGYYRRAKNLIAGASAIAESNMPASGAEWRAVPGVGDYTSAAIASIAFGERVAVVDGNVERVHARFNTDPSQGPTLKRNAGVWAQSLIDSIGDHPGDLNQALMELGATVCTPRDPKCATCPLTECQARAQGRQADFPTPNARTPVVRLTRYLLGYTEGDHVALERIPDGDWAGGMWQIPWRETPPDEPYRVVGRHLHSVTHHRITLHILRVSDAPPGTSLFAVSDLPALPSPQRKAIELLLADPNAL